MRRRDKLTFIKHHPGSVTTGLLDVTLSIMQHDVINSEVISLSREPTHISHLPELFYLIWLLLSNSKIPCVIFIFRTNKGGQNIGITQEIPGSALHPHFPENYSRESKYRLV